MPIVGAHVSAAGGLHNAITRAVDIGAISIQLFSASPRVWGKKPLDQIDVKKYAQLRKQHQIGQVVTHALYLVNLASKSKPLLERSISTLKYELEFDARVEGSGIVVHLGSHQGQGWEKVRDQVASSITEILRDTPDESTFLIENSAGQNGKIVSDLAEIKWLLDQIDSKRLGWCFDTCHGFTAGYGLGEKQIANPGKPENLRSQTATEAIDELGLWKDLRCVHVNDSKSGFGSGADRHQNLGDGEIESADLKYFLNHEKLAKLPAILEVPGIDGKGPDAENVLRLKKLVK